MSSAEFCKDVFIAHSGEDRGIVEQIVGYIEREYNLTTWYAPADVGGENFIPEIEKGIQITQAGIVFLSPSALESFWVVQEWQMMIEKRSQCESYKVILALLPGLSEESIPYSLSICDRVDLRDVNVEDPVELKFKAIDLARKVKPECVSYVKGTIRIPFVVLAMTSAEFGALISQPETPLGYLRSQWQNYRQEDLSSFYGKTREDWKPPIAGGEKTIREIVEEIITKTNRTSDFDLNPLCAQFFSYEFTSKDLQTATWDSLAYRGCILIIDAVSLFHPVLRDCLEKSDLGSNENVSIIVISPINSSAMLPINRRIEDLIREEFPRVLWRFEQRLEALCEFGIDSERALRRWLFAALPRVVDIIRSARPDPAKKVKMREQYGEPTGIDKAIFGRGER